MATRHPNPVLGSMDRFTGRAWLLTKLLQWWDNSEQRLLLVTGGPGSGKTTFAAWLTSDGLMPEDCTASAQLTRLRASIKASHFCVATSRNFTPQAFAESIALQLTRSIQGFGAALAESLSSHVSIVGIAQAGTAAANATVSGVNISRIDLSGLGDEPSFDHSFTAPIRKLYENGHSEPILLLVDALDEAHTYTGKMTLPILLSRLDDLPTCVRILVTVRDDPDVLQFFGSAPRVDLIADAPAGIDDLRTYAIHRLTKFGGVEASERKAFADRLAQRAQGIFLYAKLLLDDLLDRPAAAMPDLETYGLPNGLNQIYHDFLSRELGAVRQLWSDLYRPLLGLIAVAQGEGLSATQLARILDRELQQVDDTLRRCKQYLHGALPNGPFLPFHKSFADFLLIDNDNIDYHIDAAAMHRRIVDHFWRKHHDAQQPGECWFQADPYALDNLARHAAEAERLDTLVADPAFLVAVDPASLRSMIERCRSSETRIYCDIYLRASLVGLDGPDRASHLELAARRCDQNEIADRFANLPIDRRWRAPFVLSLSTTPFRNLGQLEGEIGGIALFPDQSDRLVVVGQDERGPWLVTLSAQGEILSRSHVANVPFGVGFVQLAGQCALAVLERRHDDEAEHLEECSYELSLSFWTVDVPPKRLSNYQLTYRPHFTAEFQQGVISQVGSRIVIGIVESRSTRIIRLEPIAEDFSELATVNIWASGAPLAISQIDGRPAVVLQTFATANIHVMDDGNRPAMRGKRAIGINDDDAWIRLSLPDNCETDATALATTPDGARYIAAGDENGDIYVFARRPGDGNLSLKGRFKAAGGAITQLWLHNQGDTVEIVSADRSNALKCWTLISSAAELDSSQYEREFFLRQDGEQTFLLERCLSTSDDGMFTRCDRLWHLAGDLRHYESDEAAEEYRLQAGLIPRRHMVFVERQGYWVEHVLHLNGPEHIVVKGPGGSRIGPPISMKKDRAETPASDKYGKAQAEFDLCRIQDRLAIIERDRESIVLWINSRSVHDMRPAAESVRWQRREIPRAESGGEELALPLVRAYLLGGSADLELTWLETITLVGATWTWNRGRSPDWIEFDTAYAEHLRVRAFDDVLLIAAAGRTTLRVFEVSRAHESVEIASLNLGEPIEDLEFVGSNGVALVTRSGGLLVAFNTQKRRRQRQSAANHQ